MKVYYNKYTQWLQSKLKESQGVLLFGSDKTTMEYCQEETLSFIKKQQNSVRVVRYTQSQFIERPDILSEEASGDLFNSHFLIFIIEECSDKIVAFLEKISSFPASTFMIFQGFGLRTTSKLVRYLEEKSQWGCVGCYAPDLPYVRSVIEYKILSQESIIHPKALDLLIQKYDFQEALGLVDKLILYKGDRKEINLQDIEQFMGQEASFHLEAFLDQVLGRTSLSFDPFTSLFLQENYLTVLRTLAYRLKRILIVLENLQQGHSLEKSLTSLNPSLLFFQKEIFCQHLKKWNITEVLQRLHSLYQAELSLKKGFCHTIIEKEILSVF
jgi:DNA polymerase III delta subunit